jgi:hypothetical protein
MEYGKNAFKTNGSTAVASRHRAVSGGCMKGGS